MYNIAL